MQLRGPEVVLMGRMFGVVLAAVSLHAKPVLALSAKETRDLVALIDSRQNNVGDYNSTAFLDQKQKHGGSKAVEAEIYRRDKDETLMIVFTKPKTEAGKGYLRVDKNLFSYDPTLGKWDRQTDRVAIAGTDSRRADFDASRLAKEYTAEYVKDEVLGKIPTYQLKLTAKSGLDVVAPILLLWVDKESKNLLKRQEKAQSGKLLRTIYFPAWDQVYSKQKEADLYVIKEMRVFDEVEKGNSTTVLIKNVRLKPLEKNIFTKAWLESRSK